MTIASHLHTNSIFQLNSSIFGRAWSLENIKVFQFMVLICLPIFLCIQSYLNISMKFLLSQVSWTLWGLVIDLFRLKSELYSWDLTENFINQLLNRGQIFFKGIYFFFKIANRNKIWTNGFGIRQKLMP